MLLAVTTFDWLFWSWAALATAVGVFSILLTFYMSEGLRFAKSRLRKHPPINDFGHSIIVAPCKGNDLELSENLRPLFEQDYPNYEVRFVVEDAADPAAAVIRRMLRENSHVQGSLTIAGRSVESGQKIHNLQAATQRLPENTTFIAFVDSDARPRPDWLRRMVFRLVATNSAAVTGYRWFIPKRWSLSGNLLHGINASAAALLGKRGYFAVWGGAWAIRRESFESLNMRQAWQGTLSDDLVATRILREKGGSIEFEPGCIHPSTLETSWRGTLEFIRRQYLIGRFYLFPIWMGAVLVLSLSLLAFWGGIGLAVMGTIAGSGYVPWIAAGIGILYSIGFVRGMLKRSMCRSFIPGEFHQVSAMSAWDAWAWPLTLLANTLLIVSSAFGNTILWRGIRYTLARGGKLRSVQHPLSANVSSAEINTPHFHPNSRAVSGPAKNHS